ncbi:MAG: hypothetical protein HUU17_03525 [Chthonomonadales bacterium]|nr:hypothetical protein [Chthonomonadales bacterium]
MTGRDVVDSPPFPAGITVQQSADELRIVRRWNRLAGIGLLAFAFVWDGFLLVWYLAAFSGHAPLIAFLFPIVHVIIGIALAYSGLANAFNTTTISVRSGRLTVVHNPIRWRAPMPISIYDLQQVFVKKHIRSGKHGRTTTYSVHALLLSGRSIGLVSGLDSREQAQFLERRLEQYLGLIDSPVAGEMS